jgi:molybdate transport system ATP-binding protein
MQFELSLRHRFADCALDLSLDGGPGVTALFGPSGAGKTTAIKVMAGLINPQEGRVRLGDRTLFDSAAGIALPPHKRRLGYVFQDGRLFPHLTVRDNLRFAQRYVARTPLSEDLLVDLLGIGGLLGRRPATLSGGETQRVALARALLSGPDMLLMDEPLAALDAPRKEEILPYLDRLKTEMQMPILYVTHAVEEVARLADHVAILEAGRITRHGPVFDVLSDPDAMPLLGVREAGAILRAEVIEDLGDGLTRLSAGPGRLELPGVTAAPGETVRLRILATDVMLATVRPEGLLARNILPVTIESVQSGRGPGIAVVLRLGDQRLLSRITGRSCEEMGLRPGQEIFAILKATSVARSGITT